MATIGILNKDQSVSLIPKTESWAYKILKVQVASVYVTVIKC